MDLSVYKLNDYDEINRWCKTEPERYGKFLSNVYDLLDGIPEKEKINVLDVVEEKDYELFIKCVCLYILEKRATGTLNDSRIEFWDEEFNVIRRTETFIPSVHLEMNPFYRNRK